MGLGGAHTEWSCRCHDSQEAEAGWGTTPCGNWGSERGSPACSMRKGGGPREGRGLAPMTVVTPGQVLPPGKPWVPGVLGTFSRGSWEYPSSEVTELLSGQSVPWGSAWAEECTGACHAAGGVNPALLHSHGDRGTGTCRDGSQSVWACARVPGYSVLTNPLQTGNCTPLTALLGKDPGRRSSGSAQATAGLPASQIQVLGPGPSPLSTPASC